MAGGAYRDAAGAIARAEALERENEELRRELERLSAAATGPRATGQEVLDLRVENELLRSMLKQAEAAPARLKEVAREHELSCRELDALRRELDAVREDRDLHVARLAQAAEHARELGRTLGVLRADQERLQAAYDDAREASRRAENHDAFVRRLIEERDDLARALRAARESGFEPDHE